jgi:hypothetical protein
MPCRSCSHCSLLAARSYGVCIFLGKMQMWGYDKLDQIRGNLLDTIKKLLEKEPFDPAINANVVKATDVSGALAGAEAAAKDVSGVPALPPKTKTQRIIAIVLQVLVYFVALMFAMLVANQMIFEPKVLRAAFFVLILSLPLISPIVLVPFAIYYIGRILYTVYLRSTPEHKNDNPKLSLLPAVFCMLPLTTVPGEYAITRFFKYPFFYPQSDESAERIDKLQKEYIEDLQGSVYKWDELMKNYSIFKEAAVDFSKELKDMNSIMVPSEIAPSVTAANVEAAEAAVENRTRAIQQAREEGKSTEGLEKRAAWNTAAAETLAEQMKPSAPPASA